MKLVINACNLNVGGGVQVAVSFINEIIDSDLSMDIVIIVSESVYKQIKNKERYPLHVIDSPSKIFKGIRIRKELDNLTQDTDVVFSVFGPTYWKPKCKHIVGFANPWIVYDTTDALSLVPWFNRFKLKIKYQFYKMLFLSQSSSFVVETDDVNRRLKNITEKDVFTVSNCFSKVYLDRNSWEELSFVKDEGFLYLLCLGNTYIHKNYDIAGHVGNHLEKMGINVRFVFTVSNEKYEDLSSLTKKYSVNLGVVTSYQCPTLYSQVDMLFLPTLLECYTANYPEAMITKTPIATSNKSFAREICLEHAIYFEPLNPYNIAMKIREYFDTDENKRNEWLNRAYDFSLKRPTSKDRAEAYLNIINSVMHK